MWNTWVRKPSGGNKDILAYHHPQCTTLGDCAYYLYKSRLCSEGDQVLVLKRGTLLPEDMARVSINGSYSFHLGISHSCSKRTIEKKGIHHLGNCKEYRLPEDDRAPVMQWEQEGKSWCAGYPLTFLRVLFCPLLTVNEQKDQFWPEKGTVCVDQNTRGLRVWITQTGEPKWTLEALSDSGGEQDWPEMRNSDYHFRL